MRLVLDVLEVDGFPIDSLLLEPAFEAGILGELLEFPSRHLQGLFDLLSPAKQIGFSGEKIDFLLSQDEQTTAGSADRQHHHDELPEHG